MGQQYSHLSSEERILIEKLHCEQHLSVRRTAERIGRDKSTVSRELRRVFRQVGVSCLVMYFFRV
ncbi:Transposase [Bifidobacterium longum subsp. longum]|nr:Transposase [Bifidobacterium longum subsp. longum]TCF71097.1 Transposase [Bifidobacterium longum subsp. longum]TCF86218.1 Transposase [Bifidobacterium longum subsp. longum]